MPCEGAAAAAHQGDQGVGRRALCCLPLALAMAQGAQNPPGRGWTTPRPTQSGGSGGVVTSITGGIWPLPGPAIAADVLESARLRSRGRSRGQGGIRHVDATSPGRPRPQSVGDSGDAAPPKRCHQLQHRNGPGRFCEVRMMLGASASRTLRARVPQARSIHVSSRARRCHRVGIRPKTSRWGRRPTATWVR